MIKRINYLLASIAIWLTFTMVTGQNGYRDLIKVREQITYQKNLNNELALININFKSNIDSLKAKGPIVEDLARRKLMLVKKDEVFFRIIKHK